MLHHPFFVRKNYYEVPKIVLRKVTASDKRLILSKKYSCTVLFDVMSHGREYEVNIIRPREISRFIARKMPGILISCYSFK